MGGVEGQLSVYKKQEIAIMVGNTHTHTRTHTHTHTHTHSTYILRHTH